MASQTSGGLIKFSFSLDEELMARVDTYARSRHLQRSPAIRQMILFFFEAMDAAEEEKHRAERERASGATGSAA